MKATFLCFVLVVTFTAAGSTVLAQKETETGIQVDQDLALIRRDLRSEKKKIIALNVPFTGDEATRFWPVYDQYAAEMTRHYDEFYALIKDFVANQKVMTDAQAISMIERWAQIQALQVQTRQRYIPLVEKVVPGKKAALFFQID